jgi:endo-1,4-beta-xylanase
MLFNVSRRGLLSAMATAPMTLAMASAGPAQTTPAFAGDSAASGARNPAPQRLFGAAVRPDQLGDETPLLHAIRGCQLLVPEYHGQWSAVEWRRGNPWYGNYDAICDFAEKHGQIVRGHSLIWEQMTPDWAREEMLSGKDWRTIERHFATLLPRYAGRIREWIVVNEMIDTENGDHGLRRTHVQRAYGNDYVRRALETARTLDPQAKLMINDYSMLYDNPVDEARRNRMLRLVEGLKTAGTPLDMVGLQGHLELRKGRISQPKATRFMADLAGMGVEVAITELDVLEDDLGRPIEERDRRVADAAQDLIDVVADEKAVSSVVTWGLSDKQSWLQDRLPVTKAAQACSPIDCGAMNRGLPFDGEMRVKPMHAALQRAVALA